MSAQAHLVKSAQRVLQVLEYFDIDRPRATVTDISRAMTYPQSSTSVLLRCLRELGYLYYDRRDRCYRPTARAALLGCWAEDGAYRGGKMLDLVDTVAMRLGETSFISAAYSDYKMHHLHVVRGSKPGSVEMRSGETEEQLHNVQANLVLSSYPEPMIRLALHRLNADEQDPRRRVNISTKVAELQQIRQRGWLISSHSHDREGPGIVAALMPRRKGGDRIVLSVAARPEVVEKQGQEFLRVLIEERDRVFGCASPLAAEAANAHGDRDLGANTATAAPRHPVASLRRVG